MKTYFSVDRESAAKVGNVFNGIDTTGMYYGQICQCEVAETPNHAQFIELSFKATKWSIKNDDVIEDESGEKLAFIKIFLSSRDGRPTFGADIFNAIMVLCGVDSCEAVPMNVFNRDNTKRQGFRIPALEKKFIGLLLQRENRKYLKDGEERDGYQMNVVTPFDVKTGKSAKETMDGTEAKVVLQRLKTLKDKPAKPLQNSSSSPVPYDDAPMTDAPF